jgi:hypothetical protein
MIRSILISLTILAINFHGKSVQAPPTESVCLSTEEKKLYDLMMEYRKANNLPPIPLSGRLTKVAQAHAKDLIGHYSFKPDNTCNPHSWSTQGAWTSCCYTSDHKQAKCMWDKPREISDYKSPGYEIAYYSSGKASAEEGLQGWKNSPSHNPLIVNQGIWNNVKWNAIGIALNGNYGIVWFGEITDDTTPSVCDN